MDEPIKIPIAEQETVIAMERDAKTASVYSSDTNWINKIKRLAGAKNSCVVIKFEDAYGITAEFPKELLTIRTSKRKLTDEQKQAAAERLRKAREGKPC